MGENIVIISVSEEELIVSLYQDYLIRYKMSNNSQEDIKLTVKAFSDYIQNYLSDRYDLDANIEEEIR